KLRSSKYLNNLIEQDHRGVKQRIAVMLGFKAFRNAAITTTVHPRQPLPSRRIRLPSDRGSAASDSPLEGSGFEPSVPASIADNARSGRTQRACELPAAKYLRF